MNHFKKQIYTFLLTTAISVSAVSATAVYTPEERHRPPLSRIIFESLSQGSESLQARAAHLLLEGRNLSSLKIAYKSSETKEDRQKIVEEMLWLGSELIDVRERIRLSVKDTLLSTRYKDALNWMNASISGNFFSFQMQSNAKEGLIQELGHKSALKLQLFLIEIYRHGFGGGGHNTNAVISAYKKLVPFLDDKFLSEIERKRVAIQYAGAVDRYAYWVGYYNFYGDSFILNDKIAITGRLEKIASAEEVSKSLSDEETKSLKDLTVSLAAHIRSELKKCQAESDDEDEDDEEPIKSE